MFLILFFYAQISFFLHRYNALTQVYRFNDSKQQNYREELTMADESILAKLEGKTIVAKGLPEVYSVWNGSRHVYVNISEIHQSVIEVTVTSNELYSIPLGKPIY
jgi:hypothetical protein